MAFKIRDLSVLAYANGFTLWHYKSREDALTAVSGDGYFDDAADMMAQGDMIHVNTAGGTATLAVKPFDSGKPAIRTATLSSAVY